MEDDYMSDEILLGISDTSTGLARSREHQRLLKINARFEESREVIRQKRKHPDEREKERRDEALSKPISEECKGFSLLAKMGFKPGMTLGKQRDSDDRPKLTTPIPIEIKVNRKGLGHEAQEESERNEKVEKHMKIMKERAEKHEELIEDFRKRRRVQSSVKTIVKDLHSSRKVCEELDHRMKLSFPRDAWFWRSFKVKEDDEETPKCSSVVVKENQNEDNEKYVYSNGLEAEPEINYNDLPEDDLNLHLELITQYLRSTHSYCIWCGTQFEDENELNEQCPGDSRSLHNSDDCHDD